MEEIPTWHLNDNGEVNIADSKDGTITESTLENLKSTVSVVYVKPELYTKLKFNEGVLFTRQGSNKLWWKTPEHEWDLTSGHTPDPLRLRARLSDARTPNYSFDSAANFGMYLDGMNELAFATNGRKRAGITNKSLNLYNSALIFNTDINEQSANTGKLYKDHDNNLVWQCGNKRLDLTTRTAGFNGGGIDVRLLAPKGSCDAPSFAFTSAPASGIYTDTTGSLLFSVNNSCKFKITNDDVYIGDISINAEINECINVLMQKFKEELEYIPIDRGYIARLYAETQQEQRPALNAAINSYIESLDLPNNITLNAEGKTLSQLGVNTDDINEMINSSVRDNIIKHAVSREELDALLDDKIRETKEIINEEFIGNFQMLDEYKDTVNKIGRSVLSTTTIPVLISKKIYPDSIFTSMIVSKSLSFNPQHQAQQQQQHQGVLRQNGNDLTWTCNGKTIVLTQPQEQQEQPQEQLQKQQGQLQKQQYLTCAEDKYIFKEAQNTGLFYNNNDLILRNAEHSITLHGDIVNDAFMSIDNIKCSFENGRLCTCNNNKKTTYITTERLVTGVQPIYFGDVVGVNKQGLARVLGSEWVKPKDITFAKGKEILSYWANITTKAHNTQTIHMYLDESNSCGNIKVDFYINNTSISAGTCNINMSTSKPTGIRIIQVYDSFIIFYNVATNTEEDAKSCTGTIIIKKVTFDNETHPTVCVASTYLYNYTSDNSFVNFSVEYDRELSTAIIIMVNKDHQIFYKMFNISKNNATIREGAELSNDDIELRDLLNSAVTTISNGTLKTLLLPGQIVLISYANAKMFLLLSSDYKTPPIHSEVYVDPDSIDCVDMIYDTDNFVLSVERTINNQCYLQIMDIIGVNISTIKKKKIRMNNIIPLGIAYNPINYKYLLFYCGIERKPAVCLFSCIDDTVDIGLSYTSSSGIIDFDCPTTVQTDTNTNKFYLINNITYCFDNIRGIEPDLYIGLACERALTGQECAVALRGQVFNCTKLPSDYVGREVYCATNKLNARFPDNLTLKRWGNTKIGFCLSEYKILLT